MESDETKLFIEQTCRACLRRSASEMLSLAFYNVNLRNTKQSQMECSASLADIYTQCTQLFFDNSSSLSEWICQECSNTLIEFFKFRKMCVESFHYLMQQKSELSENVLKEKCVAEDHTETIDAVIKVENLAEDVELDSFHTDVSNSSDGNYLASKNNDLDNKPEENRSNIDEIAVSKRKLRSKVPAEKKKTSEMAVVTKKGSPTKLCFTCNVCEQKFHMQHRYNAHMRKHDGLKPWSCKHCDKGFEKFASLQNHIASVHFDALVEKPEFMCDINGCEKVFPVKESLHKHTLHAHTGRSNHSAKKPKMGEKQDEEYFTCDACEKRFYKKHRYEAHMRKHKGLKQWSCGDCAKEFEKYASLQTHIATHHFDEKKGKPEFICDVNGCGKIYSIKDTLRAHILQSHLGLTPPKQPADKICEHCGKAFTSNFALVRHSYVHTRDTPHKCHICPKVFPTKYKLKEHLMRHDGIKNHVCPECGLCKTTMHELNVHMNYHTREKKFPCKFCPLIFFNVGNMNRHTRIVHCGVKAYQCTHCNTSFGKSETLRHHIMTHTGERPLGCSICGKRFIQPIALKTHMKTHKKNQE